MTSAPMPTASHGDAPGAAAGGIAAARTDARGRGCQARITPRHARSLGSAAHAAHSPKMSTTCSASLKPCCGGGLARPLLDVGRLDLDRQPARAADQVVVVAARRARAVEALAVGALQRVRLALRGETGEGAVDRRQSDAGVLVAEHRVQALRAHEAAARRRALRAPDRAATCCAGPCAGILPSGRPGRLPGALDPAAAGADDAAHDVDRRTRSS